MIKAEALLASFKFSSDTTVAALVARFVMLPHRVVSFSATGMSDRKPGGLRDLERRLQSHVDTNVVHFQDERGVSTTIEKAIDPDTGFDVSISARGEARTTKIIPEWAELAREIVKMKECVAAVVGRQQSSMTSFVPEPPIARANHCVVTTDAKVAAAYDDPEVFWRAWKREELADGRFFCSRALDCFDEHAWLAHTFEATMAMIRSAKAGLTEYSPPYWEEELAAWWKYGDILEERAGYPALAPIGYNPDDDCYHMAGFVTRTPISKGGKEPRHVLLKELYDLRRISRGKKAPGGQPIKGVRVTFPEKWMAEQEKRPLLDAGAEVLYGDGKPVT